MCVAVNSSTLCWGQTLNSSTMLVSRAVLCIQETSIHWSHCCYLVWYLGIGSSSLSLDYNILYTQQSVEDDTQQSVVEKEPGDDWEICMNN